MNMNDIIHLPKVNSVIYLWLLALAVIVGLFFVKKKWGYLTHISDHPRAKSRLRRRGVPIMAYVGANGSGKTFMAVYDTLLTLNTTRTILSTVEIFDIENPRPCDNPQCDSPNHPDHQALHPNFVRLTSYHQLLMAKNCDIILDEVQGFLSSRETSNLPTAVATKLLQLRKDDCVLRYTSPSWTRVDILVREVTQYVTLSVPYFAKQRKTKPGEPPALWRDRLVFFVRSFDASLVSDFDPAAANDGYGSKPRFIQILFRPTSTVQKAYDTRQSVSALGWAAESGLCLVCGGKRKAVNCICSNHKEKEVIKNVENPISHDHSNH